MEGRKQEITLLTVLMCLLVIFIHVSSAPITGLQRDSLQYLLVFIPWRLSAFVVQGFVLLSGLKLFLKRQPTLGKFYWDRVKSILIPYVLWVVIYYLYFVYLRHYFPFSFKDLGRYLVVGNLSSHFYFVVVILQFYLLMPLWRLVVDRVPMWLAVPAALLIVLALPQFPYRDRIFMTYLVYWLMGCYLGDNYQQLSRWLRNHLPLLTGILIVLAGADLFFSYRVFVLSQPVWFLESLHVLYCIAVLFFLYALALHLVGTRTLPSILPKIAGVSYAVYLSHCLVIQVVDERLWALGVESIGLAYLIRVAAVYTITLGLCLCYGKRKEAR